MLTLTSELHLFVMWTPNSTLWHHSGHSTDPCFLDLFFHLTSLVAQTVKHLAYNVGDMGSIPGLGRSSGEGNGNPFQYSCPENPMDRGAWWATVHWVAKSWTRLSDFTFFLLRFTLLFPYLPDHPFQSLPKCQVALRFRPPLSHVPYWWPCVQTL